MSEAFLRSFVNQSLVVAALEHPNVARVHDIGAAGGDTFFTTEYLHGEDLGRVLEELASRALRLPLPHVLTIGAGVAAGLQAAHEKLDGDGRPLVHGDVCPRCVLVAYDGRVKLVDFALASPDTAVGPDRDVRGLGALLFELSQVGDSPPELEAIIGRALSREPDDRFADAREVQLALEQVARSRGISLSSTALGEWLTATLGVKPEPWMIAPVEGSPPALADLPAEESTPIPAPPLPVEVKSRGPWWRPYSVYAGGLGLAALLLTVLLGVRRSAHSRSAGRCRRPGEHDRGRTGAGTARIDRFAGSTGAELRGGVRAQGERDTPLLRPLRAGDR